MFFWKKEETDFRIEIWKMDDSSEGKRAKERLTSRNILKHLLQQDIDIIYDDHGKPHVKDCHISISHTGDFVGIIVSQKNIVGIDMERIRPREKKLDDVARRFMNSEELQRFREKDGLKYFYLVWGAKEVLYKIYGKKGLDFDKHLSTDAFEISAKGDFNAWLKKDTFEKKFRICYEFIHDPSDGQDLLLTYACS